ncbi:PREDICTED: metallophosphoesterase 1 isoform X1 [Galeopterus variegatus]|uniref:Metallophosphoesterase 1 n=1 Tax=Galeopterus variegatus TaxID=482537 RepID=A0ABM0S081_GALVR|nr:PREDICTED: metallophosphoesterase 1 isoform X1 [Galeopterus variegatus]
MDLALSCWQLGREMAMTRLGHGRQTFRLLKRSSLLLRIIAVVFAVLLFCEFLVYYLAIFWCNWPEVQTPAYDSEQETPEPVLRAMFLADTHLLGEVRGHWLDKLRREWQMERAFQTALWWLQPDVVFILGDVFDEGKWSSPQAWADDVKRFQRMFRHPSHVQLKVVAGNHDIGFHYQMSTYRVKRFEKVFNSERLFSWKGINFVMVNSVALEGDGCGICSEAEAELTEISRKLNCSREVGDDWDDASAFCPRVFRGHHEVPSVLLLITQLPPPFPPAGDCQARWINRLTSHQQEQRPSQCGDVQLLPASTPVLLQHYPLYRRSDADCSGEDAAPPEERTVLFTEKYDVLSREASQKLLWWLRPRLVLSGHTHSACEVLHAGGLLELSVPSFSWRNRNNPSFIMGSLTPTDHALSKCYLPREDTVLITYCGAAGLLAVLILAHVELLASPFHFGWNLLRKHKIM